MEALKLKATTKKNINVLPVISAVAPGAEAVCLQHPLFIPPPHRIDVHVEKAG